MGTVYPPGILNVFAWVTNFVSLLNFIVAIVIPNEIRRDEELDIMANSLKPPITANMKPILVYAMIAIYGVVYLW